MKKLLIGILVFVVVAIGGALIAPSFIDWNAYRGEIATEVRKATGRKLAIDGTIKVALLPAPMLSVGKVRLANLDGAKAADMARLDALDVRIAFWPLLSGKIQVLSVMLRGADIELEALADGRVNWEFAPAGKAASPAATAEAGEAAAAAEAVRLDQVIISGGRVTFRDSRKNTVEKVEAIDLRLAAETLTGPFAARGRATLRGVPVAFEARLGHLREDRASPLTATVELVGAKAKADITGQVVALGVAPRADIKLQLTGDSLAGVLDALSGVRSSGPSPLAQKFSLSAGLAGDAQTLAVNDMALVINGTRVTGALNARLGTVPSVDATFAVNTIDLDSWIAAAAAAPAKSAERPGAGTPSGMAPKAVATGGFTLPDDLRVAFDARVAGITYNKGAIRNVAVQGVMERGIVNIARVAAELPGGSDVTLSGRVSTPKGTPRFDGRFDAKAADLRVLLAWAGVDNSAIAADRLHKASFGSALGITGDRVELRDMDIRFDSTRLGGGIVVALRDRIGIGANITVDAINLDAYMASGVPAKSTAASAPVAGKKAADGGGLAAFDANIRASVGRMTVKGMALRGLAFDGSLIGGDLAVKSLNITDFAGGKLALSGKVTGLDKEPVPDFRFALTTNSPDKLLAAAGLSTTIPAARLRPFSFDGAFKAEAKATRLDANLVAGALRVALKGTLADLAAAPRAQLTLKADHPSYTEFTRLFLPDFTPRVAGKGPFSLSARAEGAGLDIRLSDVAARFGEAQVTGIATLALAAMRPKLTADFKAGAIVADQFIPASVGLAPGNGAPRRGAVPSPSGAPWSGEPLDLNALRGFDADVKIEATSLDWRAWRVNTPRIDLTLADGRFDLRRVSGKTVGGTFLATGGMVAPAKKGGIAELKADIDITRADLSKAMFNATELDIAKGTVTFRMNIAGRGASSRALVSSLNGAGNLEAVDGAITGFDLGRVNDQLKNLNQPTAFLSLLQTAMSGGTTKFSKIAGTFRIEKGVLRSEDIALAADGGTGSATIVADLPKWTIDAQSMFRLTGHRDAPPFRMALKGPLDKPSRIFNVNELQSWIFSKGAGALIQQFIIKKKPAPQQNAAPSTAQPTAPSQPKPDEFIRGIFDLLNKKK